MRAVIGYAAVHAALIGTGLMTLRCFGLVGRGRRATAAVIGPALLTGVALVVPLLIALLVIGVPLTLWTAALVCVVCVSLAAWISRRREVAADLATRAAAPGGTALRRLALGAAAAYAAFGAYALIRLPTQGDDAHIWSLKGLTLAYHDSLRGEIFHNALIQTIHPVYPLLQPVLEAVLFRGMGRPELRLFHTELWLVFAAAIWTAAFLIARVRTGSARSAVWLAPLGLIAVAPIAITGISGGFADVTGSVLLATGTLAVGLWVDSGENGYLALGAVLLAAAASTKDEDMVGAALVLIVTGLAVAVRWRAGSPIVPLRRWITAVAFVLAVVLPWRIWVAAHHLTDNVTPPLPRALSPAYVIGRGHQLHLAASAMLARMLSGWGWLAAVFFAVCIVCLATRTARQTAGFYLIAVSAIGASLLWLYTTTPISLGYLIPTSMDRTVGVFMAIAGIASAHLLARLGDRPRGRA